MKELIEAYINRCERDIEYCEERVIENNSMISNAYYTGKLDEITRAKTTLLILLSECKE